MGKNGDITEHIILCIYSAQVFRKFLNLNGKTCRKFKPAS